MSRSNNQIWQITAKMPSGQLQAYRSTNIGEHAVQINSRKNYGGVLAIWTTLQLLANQEQNVLRFVPGRQKGFVFHVWALITSFNIGDNNPDIFLPLNTVGNYALCLKDRPITRGIFPIIFHPDVLVQAVLHGDETMVRNILRTNPDLLQIGEGVNFSGREFNQAKSSALTALQAAIASQDFAPNKNSTGLCELLINALKRQHPDRWQQIAHDQTLELYTKSLRFYAEKQENKIRDLVARKDAGEAIDDAAIQAAIQRHRSYLEALSSNDLTAIINAHTNLDPDPTDASTLDAQKDHVIQVDQALIDAIEAATDAEIQAVLDDPTIDSPLSNLIKQFRKEVDSICQSEIIFNSQHLLKLFTLYDAFYTRVMNADPDWKKRELFWCHLVGHVQRYLPACDAQIFANPGLYDVVEEAAKNTRSFDFKYSSGSISNNRLSLLPLAFDSKSGLGYEFAGRCVGVAGRHGERVRSAWRAVSKLMLSKNSELSKLVTQFVRACALKSERRCVVS